MSPALDAAQIGQVLGSFGVGALACVAVINKALTSWRAGQLEEQAEDKKKQRAEMAEEKKRQSDDQAKERRRMRRAVRVELGKHVAQQLAPLVARIERLEQLSGRPRRQPPQQMPPAGKAVKK